MSGQENGRRRDLVDVADLESDDPVLDVIDDPDPMPATGIGDPLDELYEAIVSPSSETGRPASKPMMISSDSSGASSGLVTS